MARNERTLAFIVGAYKVRAKVSTNNAAFHDNEGNAAPEYELHRIRGEITSKLRSKLAEREPDLSANEYEGKVRDVNGNTVGTWLARREY